MWPKNRYVIHLPGKFALSVSGITQPFSWGFFLKKKEKKNGEGGDFLSEKALGTKL